MSTRVKEYCLWGSDSGSPGHHSSTITLVSAPALRLFFALWPDLATRSTLGALARAAAAERPVAALAPPGIVIDERRFMPRVTLARRIESVVALTLCPVKSNVDYGHSGDKPANHRSRSDVLKAALP